MEQLTNKWWSQGTVALVTGSNKGIGLEIVRQLARYGLIVILAARDEDRGKKAIESLCFEGFDNVVFHQLDITKQISIQNMATWIKEEYGGLDILVNNAGVNFNAGDNNSIDYAELVMETNYYGSKNLTEAMVPLIRPSPFGGRIVFVSSRLGRFRAKDSNKSGTSKKISNSLRETLEKPENLAEEIIDCVIRKFLEEVKQGTWTHGGWPGRYTDYSVSKIALNAYARLLARRLQTRLEGNKIHINCYCPGFTKTDMTGQEGFFTIEQAADTAVWLSLRPDPPTGCFFGERRPLKF